MGYATRAGPVLAVLGGNDPHSYGVTSHRASMNTLRPNSLYEKTLREDINSAPPVSLHFFSLQPTV